MRYCCRSLKLQCYCLAIKRDVFAIKMIPSVFVDDNSSHQSHMEGTTEYRVQDSRHNANVYNTLLSNFHLEFKAALGKHSICDGNALHNLFMSFLFFALYFLENYHLLLPVPTQVHMFALTHFEAT